MTIVLRDPDGSAERDDVLRMLRTICPEAGLQVNDDGSIRVQNAAVCRDPGVSCRCICHLVEFGRTLGITVNDNLGWASGGVTSPSDIDEGTLQPDGSPGPGCDSEVEIQPGDNYEAPRDDDPTQFVDEPDWLILAHELCGHALHMMRGDELRAAPQADPVRPYPENHRQAADAGAAIRTDKGLPAIDQESVRRK